MKIIIKANEHKYCPICGRLHPVEYNYCPKCDNDNPLL